MTLEMPRLWWIGFMIGLVLLATGGVLDAVRWGMEDNHGTDGCGFRYGPPPEDVPEGVECNRLAIDIVNGLARASKWPGVAIAILAGVYLLGSAIVGGFARDGKDRSGGEGA